MLNFQWLRVFTVTITAMLLLSGCQVFDPYAVPVVAGVDDLVAPDDEKPTNAELQNDLATVAILPFQDHSESALEGIDGVVNTKLSEALRGTGRLQVITSGREARDIIDRLREQGRSAYEPGSGAEVGRLLQARYVAYSVIHTITLGYEEVWDQQGNVSYNASSTATASFIVIDAQTGVFILQSTKSATQLATFDAPPSEYDMAAVAIEAVKDVAHDLQPDVGKAFPVFGYITELRGNREVALLRMPGASELQVGTTVTILRKREKVDPVTGDIRVQYETIGSLRVRLIDQNGIWCSTESGQERIRLGHPARSEGRGADSGLEDFLDSIF